MDKAFIDVNREQYMNALFLDLQKSTKMVDLPNKADLIYDFVSNNASKSESLDSNGAVKRNGKFLIKARKKKK